MIHTTGPGRMNHQRTFFKNAQETRRLRHRETQLDSKNQKCEDERTSIQEQIACMHAPSYQELNILSNIADHIVSHTTTEQPDSQNDAHYNNDNATTTVIEPLHDVVVGNIQCSMSGCVYAPLVKQHAFKIHEASLVKTCIRKDGTGFLLVEIPTCSVTSYIKSLELACCKSLQDQAFVLGVQNVHNLLRSSVTRVGDSHHLRIKWNRTSLLFDDCFARLQNDHHEALLQPGSKLKCLVDVKCVTFKIGPTCAISSRLQFHMQQCTLVDTYTFG